MNGSRFNKLQELFDNQKYFKMICGAGNEDLEEVKRLTMIYTLAGAKGLDISATPAVVESCVDGIDRAFDISDSLDINLKTRPYIMVSVGMPGDHHVRKSYIDPFKCVGCDLCVPVCPTDAIPKNFTKELDLFKDLGGSFETEDQSKEIVIKDLCIGCGKCSNICPKDDIISYRHNARALRELLPKCREAGAETFELHAAVGEHDVTMEEWKIINEINTDNFNSMCLDRLNLGNLNLEFRIREAQNISKERTLIQADGYPMSGGENDYNTTLQAVACADVINKEFNMRINKKIEKDEPGKAKLTSKRFYRPFGHRLGVPILLSGGTNAVSRKLSDMAGVRCNGVAIGTYARDIVEDYVQHPDFYRNVNMVEKAYKIGKSLIKANEMETDK